MNEIALVSFGIILTGMVIGGYTLGKIIRGSRSDGLRKADVILVFGAAVWPDGPSLSLRVRVARAAELYLQGWAPMIFCSGGWSNGQSEAAVMRDLFMKQGIPAPVVIPDDGGISTYAAIQSIKRFQGRRWKRIIAVSSPYHLYRIKREAKRQGVDVILCSAVRQHSSTWSSFIFDVRQYVRELTAVPVYAMRGLLHRVLENRWGRMVKGAARQIYGRLLALFSQADAVAESSDVISQLIKSRVAGFSDTETVLTPASGLSTPVSGLIGDRFGIRHRRLHSGVDFRAGYGSTVVAAAAGIVLFSGNMGPYGNVVIIHHGGGLATVYAHLSSFVVGDTDKLTIGQHIGFVGETGRSSGPHLHFEVRVHGSPVEPLVFLSQ